MLAEIYISTIDSVDLIKAILIDLCFLLKNFITFLIVTYRNAICQIKTYRDCTKSLKYIYLSGCKILILKVLTTIIYKLCPPFLILNFCFRTSMPDPSRYQTPDQTVVTEVIHHKGSTILMVGTPNAN